MTLFEGVPPHLRASLLSWLVDHCLPSQPRAGYTWPGNGAGELQWIERTMQWDLGSGGHRDRYDAVLARVKSDDTAFLNLLDAYVQLRFSGWEPELEALELMLVQGGSAWQVNLRTRGKARIERRVELTVQETLKLATSVEDNATSHLRSAWGYAFGRNPEPGPAYQEAVAALEATFDAIVIPIDPGATLGKVIAAVKAKPEKWRTRLTARADPVSGVLTVVARLDVIWKTQERHGSSKPGAPVSCSLEEAQDAVVEAAALVQLVRQGGFAPS